MDCTRFEEGLFELLEGTLDGPLREELTAHADECLRCRNLESLLTGAAGAVTPPDDMVASVLALTSERDPLERALRQLDLDLPALATVVPDPDFVADVMTATVEADRRRFRYRARSFWQGLVARPRFALEGAYLGGIAVFLLVGLPGSPLAGVSDQVLREIRNEDGAVRAVLSEGTARVTRLSQATWARAGNLAGSAFADRLPRAADLADSSSWLAKAATALDDFWRDTLHAALDWLRTAWVNTVGATPDNSRTTNNGTNDDDERNV